MNNEQYNRYLEDCYGVEDFQSLREWGPNFNSLLKSEAKDTAKNDINVVAQNTAALIIKWLKKNKNKEFFKEDHILWKFKNADIQTIVTYLTQLFNKATSGDKQSQQEIDEICSEVKDKNLSTLVAKKLTSTSLLGSVNKIESSETNKAIEVLLASIKNGKNTDLSTALSNIGINLAASPDDIEKYLNQLLKVAPEKVSDALKTVTVSIEAPNENADPATKEAAKKEIEKAEKALKYIKSAAAAAEQTKGALATQQAMLHPEIAAAEKAQKARARALKAANQETLNKNNTTLVNAFLQNLYSPNGSLADEIAKDLEKPDPKKNNQTLWDPNARDPNREHAANLIKQGLEAEPAKALVDQFINSLNKKGMNLIKTGQTLGSGSGSGSRSASSNSGSSATTRQGFTGGREDDNSIIQEPL